jgi:hypothetical protein
MREELEKIREWADSKIAAGSEPPFAFYRYMQLREAADAILGGFSMSIPMPEDLPESALHQGTGLRLVVSNGRPSSTPHRQPDGTEEPSK